MRLPLGRIVQTALEVDNIDIPHGQTLGNNSLANRSLAAAGATANQQMGNLIRVPGDRSVQRCTQQDFQRL